MHEGSPYSISSPTLAICWLLIRWYFTVVWICIYLTSGDVEHLSCICWPTLCLLWRNVILWPLPILWSKFFCYWVINIISEISPDYDIHGYNWFIFIAEWYSLDVYTTYVAIRLSLEMVSILLLKTMLWALCTCLLVYMFTFLQGNKLGSDTELFSKGPNIMHTPTCRIRQFGASTTTLLRN